MISKLTNTEIEKLLKSNFIGRIACHSGDEIYIVPISYAYDGTYIYVRSFDGKKIEMMRKNPRVCFQVDNMKDMANWESVIAWGQFEELADQGERDKALQILINRQLPPVSSETTHLGGIWPFPPEDLNTIEGIIFRIMLTEKTGRFERSEVPLIFTR